MTATNTQPLAALLASHPEECAAVVAVLVVDDFNGLHPDDIGAGLPHGMRVSYAEMMAILSALENAGIAENCQPDWQLLNNAHRYAIARMGAAAWLRERVGPAVVDETTTDGEGEQR